MSKNDETTEEIEDVEGEVVISESPGGEPGSTRTIRVYDKTRGDFTLELPSECSITFGYFNPATAGMRDEAMNYGRGRGGETMKTTALRIYKGASAKTGQLACFLGVDGFRDLSLKLTRLRQRVVIESNFEDDGEGNQAWGGKEQRKLIAAAEEEGIF